MTYIYYTLIPLLLLLTIVLLRKRGMKPKNGTGVHWDMFRENIREATLHPQEKSNPTEERN